MVFGITGACKKTEGQKEKLDCDVCESLDFRLPEQASVALQACV